MTVFGVDSLQNTYRDLGEQFYSDQLPTPVAEPELICVNHALAEQLNVSANSLDSEEALQVLAGNAVPGSLHPIATVYAGHQFGGWNPQLGDGRAILLGEVLAKDNKRYDIQLKGAGRTPYSRMGDGRSPLGPVLREYLVSEAMAALGIPTTRALAAVSTGETVIRDSVLPGAILTRVAQSHIRIGTVQYFSARNDLESVQVLADYVIERHYAIQVADAVEKGVDRYTALLSCVAKAQARLVAQWMAVGFIHGVMNTDNTLLSGETVDYGPCAFMDSYHPDKVFSSIDHYGRYAFANQAEIARWNLSWLAQAWLPLMDGSQDVAIGKAESVLEDFIVEFKRCYSEGFARKLGFSQASATSDVLLRDLLQLMAANGLDFTLSFRALADCLAPETERLFIDKLIVLPASFKPWQERWQIALDKQNISVQAVRALIEQANPLYIPRNHLIERAIVEASEQDNFDLFHQLTTVLSRPFDYREELQMFAAPPGKKQEVRQTFCGT